MSRRRRKEEEPQAEESRDEPDSSPAEAAKDDLRGQVDMTYLGTSGRFVDRITGLTWEVGQTHRIGSVDAQRIIDAVPQDNWEKVRAVGDPPPAPPEPEVAPKPEETPGF